MTTHETTRHLEPGQPGNWPLPGIAFALRFGNEDGFVQRFFALHRDLVARELGGTARCLLTFKELGDDPAYSPRWAEEKQADLYNYSAENKVQIKRFVQENRIAMVVFQSANIGEVDLKFLRDLGVRTINTEDSSFDHARSQPVALTAMKFLSRRVLKLNVHDLHIANSQGQYEFLSRFAVLPRRRLRMVRYGIDTTYFGPGDCGAARVRLGLAPETVWIMAAAQSRPEKRVDLLIDAIRRVKDARPHAPIGFFYVGDGLLLEQWKQLARELPSSADYRFFGKQSDMRPFYHAASMFIHGAIKESFGLVLVEAMASGLPVIATLAHGPAEIIQDGSTGYLVDQDDWSGFINAILRYVDQPELRRQHGDMGRRRCLELYTSDRQALEVANLIRSLLGEGAR